ncbi:MAG: Mur ligase family protein [Gaiellaceae bacterium]
MARRGRSRYSLGDIPALLRTAPGRAHIHNALRLRLWPLLRLLAAAHRRTFARRACMVVVVGSLGKTTTTRAALAALGKPAELPDKNALAFLARSVFRIRPGARQVVLEAGIDRKGLMAGYASMLRPDVVVVTSVASEHNRSLGDLATTRAEKGVMVQALPPDGVAILNGDDPNVLSMRELTRARVVTFGFGPDNDVRASDLELDWPFGMRLTVHAQDWARRLHVRLLGRHMAYPVLAATAVAIAEGASIEASLGAIERLAPTPLRLQPLRLPSGAYLLRDEYKSALETVHAAFDLLSEIPATRRFAVMGDISEPPGSQGPLYRELGARLAAMGAHAVIVSSLFQAYSIGARRAGMPSERLIDAGTDPLAAARLLADRLGPGDVVLVKGRDTQRLERVSLALMGRPVRCAIPHCRALARCEACPMLERGWDGVRGRRPVSV